MPNEHFTVFGAGGFIGRNLCAYLQRLGFAVRGIGRGESIGDQPLGHVIWAIGLTGDFLDRPLDTVEAHVNALVELIGTAKFDSLLYLSSTRMYGAGQIVDELMPLSVNPSNPQHLYNISKLMGESLTMNCTRPTNRVVRLSNIVGRTIDSPNFVDSLVRDALTCGGIVLRGHPQTTRDYLFIDDAIEAMANVALHGRERLYNLASGVAIANQEIVDLIQRCTGCAVEMAGNGSPTPSPVISIERARRDFNFSPAPVLPRLASSIQEHARSAWAA